MLGRNLSAHGMKAMNSLAGAIGSCAWVCANTFSPLAHAGMPSAELYQRATNEFAFAEFYKPVETRTNEPSYALAPLILQQVKAAKEPPSMPDRFGTLSLSNGAVVLDPSHPTVYWEADTVQIQGTVLGRFSYVWCYATRPDTVGPGQRPNTVSAGRTEPGMPLQGIRITLNPAGQPAIWEVLADSSGVKLFFVSQNLEAAAMTEFGTPLPGRRFAAERSVEEAPDVVIARVLDDSPVASGPIVYLNADTRVVSTLTCRCMPAQAKKLLGTSTYGLLPFQAASTNFLITRARMVLAERVAFWPGDGTDRKRLEACLRLPDAFFGARKGRDEPRISR